MPPKNPIFLIFEVEYLTPFAKMSNLKCFQHLKRVTLRILLSKSLSGNLFACISVQPQTWISQRNSVPRPSAGIKPLPVTRIFSTGGWEFAHHGVAHCSDTLVWLLR